MIEEKTEFVTVSYENHMNADSNKPIFAIKPQSCIDNEVGMRGKRIQYLIDGYTSDNPPSGADLEKLMTKIEIPILNGSQVDRKILIVNKKLANEIQSVFT